tara:strand:+ start:345 stop:560 length:216 start_codon:yes stop_codon:yes gene_type:complete
MSTTYDFQIIRSGVPGISLVMSMNEDAFSYITDEADMNILPNGAALLSNYRIWDFIDDAERCQFSSALAIA